MNRTGAVTVLNRRMLMAVTSALALSGCTQHDIGDPWAGKDPQWKRSHFVSQTPDQALRERAALTQIDR